MEAWLHSLLAALALPQFGLSTVFVVALLSATLLPMGSEPAVFGLVKLNPDLFWPAVLVATAGNTLGGAISWWMGYGAERTYERVQTPPAARAARAAMAAALRPQGLPAELAAGRGRPAVRGGRLAAPAVLALRGLHGRSASSLRYVTMTAAPAVGLPGAFQPDAETAARASIALRSAMRR